MKMTASRYFFTLAPDAEGGSVWALTLAHPPPKRTDLMPAAMIVVPSALVLSRGNQLSLIWSKDVTMLSGNDSSACWTCKSNVSHEVMVDRGSLGFKPLKATTIFLSLVSTKCFFERVKRYTYAALSDAAATLPTPLLTSSIHLFGGTCSSSITRFKISTKTSRVSSLI